MAIQTTYTNIRANFAEYCNRVTEDRETVIIQRRGAEDVAMIAASELNSLLELMHLLRSPKNAKRLLTALNRAQSEQLPAQSIEELQTEIGFK